MRNVIFLFLLIAIGYYVLDTVSEITVSVGSRLAEIVDVPLWYLLPVVGVLTFFVWGRLVTHPDGSEELSSGSGHTSQTKAEQLGRHVTAQSQNGEVTWVNVTKKGFETYTEMKDGSNEAFSLDRKEPKK